MAARKPSLRLGLQARLTALTALGLAAVFVVVGLIGLRNQAASTDVVLEQRLALARARPPDIVLMDISLPQVNGIEATRQIKSSAPQARVAMLSIHEASEYLAQAAAAGASPVCPSAGCTPCPRRC